MNTSLFLPAFLTQVWTVELNLYDAGHWQLVLMQTALTNVSEHWTSSSQKSSMTTATFRHWVESEFGTNPFSQEHWPSEQVFSVLEQFVQVSLVAAIHSKIKNFENLNQNFTYCLLSNSFYLNLRLYLFHTDIFLFHIQNIQSCNHYLYYMIPPACWGLLYWDERRIWFHHTCSIGLSK